MGTSQQNALDGLRVEVAVVGGGQAGLSTSFHLQNQGISHVVLERDRVGHEWRERRWDSFCLVTPNWQCQLPGHPYRGADPHGFMLRAEILDYLSSYVREFSPPLYEGVSVLALRAEAGGFALETTAGQVHADQVVVATGPYQVPVLPRMAERLPAGIVQLHSSQYRNGEQLPPGDVLVVGTGQSGCQIAEDLHLTGRRVHLAVGSAPRVARFYRGRDVVDWLDAMGYYDKPVTEFDDEDAVRARANHYVTGRDGGRDIDLRRFAVEGMSLYGRLESINEGRLGFGDRLAADLDAADGVSESIKDTIDAYLDAQGIDAPSEDRYTPPWSPAEDHPRTLDASTLAGVVWSTGFRRDYRWIRLPIFDGTGYPVHHRGVTSYPGLYFVGLPWQHTWGSGRFSGVARDAEHLVAQIAAARREVLVGG